MRIRTTSISCKRSVKLSPNHSTETYSVSKTPFVFVVLVGEEGADPCSSPTEDGDCEGNLSFVTWMGELRIVDGPECNIKLDQLLFTKKLLLLLLVHDQAFLGQRISCPLMDSCLARETLQVSSERTYVVYCTSVFLIDQIAGNSSKSSKVPLRESVYRIDGDPFVVDSSPADSDVEAKEVFNGGKLGRRYTFPKTPWPGRMGYVDRGTIIGKYHSRVALLLFNRIHPSARLYKYSNLSGIEPTFALTSHSVPMPNSDPPGSSLHTLCCP